jgi:hypothetical protein
MKLIPDWRRIVRKAWSVKAMILTAIFACGEIALPLLHQSIAEDLQGWCALAAGLCAMGSVILRIMPQAELHESDKPEEAPTFI